MDFDDGSEAVRKQLEKTKLKKESDDHEDGFNPFDDPARKGTQVGTVNYMAPEMIQNNQAYLATDLWAFGCIIFKMLSGTVPFEGVQSYQVF